MTRNPKPKIGKTKNPKPKMDKNGHQQSETSNRHVLETGTRNPKPAIRNQHVTKTG